MLVPAKRFFKDLEVSGAMILTSDDPLLITRIAWIAIIH